ncbi:MAG: hypothetical protein U1F67_07975 [Rubrivivax sp.]
MGFIDQPAVTVLQARDLAEAFRPPMANVREQASFTSVAWSSDGRALWAGGDYRQRRQPAVPLGRRRPRRGAGVRAR